MYIYTELHVFTDKAAASEEQFNIFNENHV